MPNSKQRSGRKVNAFIPDDLYLQVSDLKYKTWTEAIISGLELLVESTGEVQFGQVEVQESTQRSTLDDSKVLRARLEELQAHNETLKLELDRLTEMYDKHVLQTQTLINMVKNTNMIEVPKKAWWKFWK